MKNKHDTNWLFFFDQLAATSQDPTKTADWSRVGFQNRYQFVEDTLKDINKKKDFKLLDCGCGVGHYLKLARDYKAYPIGLDFSFNMLHNVKQKGFLCSLGHIENIPFKDNSFDVILSIGSLQYLKCADKCINQFARILNPCGILILVTLSKQSFVANYQRFLGKEDKRVYTQKELATAIKSSGLTTKQLRYLFYFPMGFNSLSPIFNNNTLLNRIFFPLAHAICLVAAKDT